MPIVEANQRPQFQYVGQALAELEMITKFTEYGVFRVAAALCFALSLPINVNAGGYSFKLIADTRGDFAEFSGPRTNDTGAVAFVAELDSGEEVVLAISDGVATTIADTAGDFRRLFGPSAINAAGTVAFRARRESGELGVFTGNGGPLVTIAVTSDSSAVTSIDNAGTVVFEVGIWNISRRKKILAGNGGPLTRIVDNDGMFNWVDGGLINESGAVVFGASVRKVPGIYLIDGKGQIMAIAESRPDFWPVISNGYAFNDLGKVVFAAKSSVGGSRGIYTGPDVVRDRIIEDGDALHGTTVANAWVNNYAVDLNNHGQIAFHTELLGGSRSIFVAKPAAVPQDVVGIGDLSGDGVPDLAVIYQRSADEPDSPLSMQYFSGASGKVIRSAAYLNPAWTNIAVDTFRDVNRDGIADDPAVAVLATNDGKHVVQVGRTNNDALVQTLQFLSPNWEAIDLATIDDLNGDGLTDDPGIAVLGFNPGQDKIVVQVRRLMGEAVVANREFLNPPWLPVALATVTVGGTDPALGVLAQNPDSGELVVQSRLIRNGALKGSLRFLDANWRGLDLATVTDVNRDGVADDPAYVILAQNPFSRKIVAQSRRVDTLALHRSISLTCHCHALRVTGSGDINGNVAEELGVLMHNLNNGNSIVQLRDYRSKEKLRNVVVFR